MNPSLLSFLDWTAIVVYTAAMVAISAYHSRKLQNQDEVFLAGRTMSRWPVAISMYMAIFSTNTFLGVTGWVNRPDGTIWIGLQTIGIILAVPVVVWLYPDLFFRLRITSAYEYLEQRFDYSVRAVATAFFAGARIMWMATMLYAVSLLAQGILGSQLVAIFVIGLLGAVLAMAGGMHAVIWNDVVQFVIFVTAVAASVIVGVMGSGGPGEVIRIGWESGKFTPPQWISLTDEMSILGALLLGFIGMLSSSGADQVALQNYLAAKDAAEAKAAIWRNGLFLKPFSLIFPVLGLVLFAYYKTHPELVAQIKVPDDSLPVFVMHALPAGIRGLMIVAIIASVIDSLESGMLALSAAVQLEMRRRGPEPWSERTTVIVARTLLLLSGALVIAVACWIRTLGAKNNLIQILNIVMYPFSGVLLGVFLAGILSRRANARGILIGAACGFIGTAGIPLLKTALPALRAAGVNEDLLTTIDSVSRVSSFYFGFLGTIATVTIGWCASHFFARPSTLASYGKTAPREAPGD
jgi:SSS family transporter